jgi:protein MpaA
VQGRELVLFTRAVSEPVHRVLVVGAVHGNEPASPPTVRGLLAADVPDGVELLLVPELNPDGVAAGVRCNANGVDLNRNFPWGWRPDDGGPGPLSEPETAAVADLITRTDPSVVVWVHQPYGYVSSIGSTSSAFEQAWAAGSGTPVRPDVTQHGGGESWTALEAGRPSMLIEIDTWDATPEIVAAHRAGFEALLAQL